MTIETQCRNLYASIKRLVHKRVLIYTGDTKPVARDMYLEKNRVPYKTSLDMYSHRGLRPPYLLNIKCNRTIERMKEGYSVQTYAHILLFYYTILYFYFNLIFTL